ncbi:3-deoxy-manno-octulosonate cytidylyltransferase [Micavibrio aeruginosavorus]|uniref:Cytidylyltransferase family protein n=1 Tax=Micavibrio aeruginosavorus (strain ARL-13) TaxID=856793 RepID=G2KQD6_MICAA|nr:3-deoxy-manno-octulosonate cytidylyltransferase [Micavibrio aeruginosavorus]AEP09072.1 cytidylyltransferase family protein [Micavibrio aeruginosavorus ARL-13]
MSSIAIIIPARYGSTRFPGKPLTKIAGITMLDRVVRLARKACEDMRGVIIAVATEDQRIADHAATLDVPCYLTSDDCPTGSDRVLAAMRQMDQRPDFIVNLQGDAPFTPPSIVHAVIKTWVGDPAHSVVTPIVRLSWDDLDRLRDNKKTTPFSGTTCVTDAKGQALWFSKNIIPAIRKEDKMRGTDATSPVQQHIGLYGFRTDVLERFVTLPAGRYEELEGLEQLRLLENNIPVQTVAVDLPSGTMQAGIDSPEDVARAEAMLKEFGDPLAA